MRYPVPKETINSFLQSFIRSADPIDGADNFYCKRKGVSYPSANYDKNQIKSQL